MPEGNARPRHEAIHIVAHWPNAVNSGGLGAAPPRVRDPCIPMLLVI